MVMSCFFASTLAVLEPSPFITRFYRHRVYSFIKYHPIITHDAHIVVDKKVFLIMLIQISYLIAISKDTKNLLWVR